MNLQTFLLGIMAGIMLVVCSFSAVSEIAGIKWQPVHAAIPYS